MEARITDICWLLVSDDTPGSRSLDGDLSWWGGGCCGGLCPVLINIFIHDLETPTLSTSNLWVSVIDETRLENIDNCWKWNMGIWGTYYTIPSFCLFEMSIITKKNPSRGRKKRIITVICPINRFLCFQMKYSVNVICKCFLSVKSSS